MSFIKFNEFDRKRAVKEVEKFYNVKLKLTGSRKKFFTDETGKSYWVFGGYEKFHGFPVDELIEEEIRKTNGVLIICQKSQTVMDIYAGELRSLVENKGKLYLAKDQYKFFLENLGDFLLIRFKVELPKLRLTRISSITYTDEEMKNDQKRHKQELEIDNAISILEKHPNTEEIVEGLKISKEKLKNESERK